MLEIAGALWPGWSGSSSTNPAYRITAIGRGARAEASDEVRKAGDLRRRPGPSVPRPSGPAGADRPGYREAGWRHQDGQESGRRRGRGGHRLGHELRDTVSRVDLGRNRVDRTIPVGEDPAGWQPEALRRGATPGSGSPTPATPPYPPWSPGSGEDDLGGEEHHRDSGRRGERLGHDRRPVTKLLVSSGGVAEAVSWKPPKPGLLERRRRSWGLGRTPGRRVASGSWAFPARYPFSPNRFVRIGSGMECLPSIPGSRCART